jgi:hypothetical protein
MTHSPLDSVPLSQLSLSSFDDSDSCWSHNPSSSSLMLGEPSWPTPSWEQSASSSLWDTLLPPFADSESSCTLPVNIDLSFCTYFYLINSGHGLTGKTMATTVPASPASSASGLSDLSVTPPPILSVTPETDTSVNVVQCNAPLLAPRPLPYHSPTFLQFEQLPDFDEDLSHPPYTKRSTHSKRKRDTSDELDSRLAQKRRVINPSYPQSSSVPVTQVPYLNHSRSGFPRLNNTVVPSIRRTWPRHQSSHSPYHGSSNSKIYYWSNNATRLVRS